MHVYNPTKGTVIKTKEGMVLVQRLPSSRLANLPLETKSKYQEAYFAPTAFTLPPLTKIPSVAIK